MSDKKNSRSAAPKTKRASATKKSAEPVEMPAAKSKKKGAESTAAVVKTRKAKAETVAAPPAKRAAKTEKAVVKTKKAAAQGRARKVPAEAGHQIGEPVMEPIGDVSGGEARTYLGDAEPSANAELEAFRADTAEDAMEATLAAAPEPAAQANEAHRDEAGDDNDAIEATAEPRPPANLERLQKILSQAGIASRRHAEELIVAGRVMVNGQVVTTLGSKADPARDHIRVDGKLLQGAERHRYFVLNKPKGYVTTVSDPEGRSTVMEFFARMSERLYPVGRLDYQSEGLLLMTNDGELANLLTKAGSGVEKTYLVKVAGQPSEDDLERLRRGVAIEREEAGSERVRTAPARIRPVREGNNPWYEVVLIEGRNRELRKMFSAVGHFVEKIRRVGYGPLVLDVEPGNLRELTPEEVTALRLTAEGKLKPKRLKVDRIPPAEARRAPEKRLDRGGERRESGGNRRFDRPAGPGGKPGFGGRRESRPFSGPKPEFEKRRFDRPGFDKPRFDRPAGPGGRPGFGGRRESRPFSGPKPEFEKRSFDRPRFEKPASGRLHIEPETDRPGGFAERPKFEGRKPFAGGKRPFGGGRPSPGARSEFAGPRVDRPRPERLQFDRPGTEKPRFEKRSFDKPRFDNPRPERPRFNKPAFGDPPRGPSEGRRDDGPRQPFRPRQEDRPGGFNRPSSPGGAGRPKAGFGGRPGGFSKPNRPGGFNRPNKPGGGARSGPRPGGGRPSGRNFGPRKRG